MTEPLYHTDAYLQEFTAQVVAADGARVALDRTAFYATSGGQPHDTGMLSAGDQTWEVREVRREGDQIRHTLAGADAPPVGTAVTGRIDWARRYKQSR